MVVLKKTAALVAVFFMLITGGCYTKLKHPEPVLIPASQADGDNVYDWDFSHGWRSSYYAQYERYKGYYITQWWHNCSWSCDFIGVDEDTDDYYAYEDIYIPFIPSIIILPEYSHNEPAYSDQSGQNKKVKHAEKIEINKTNKEKVSGNNKIKHHGRR